ncbi:sulfatase family protein [Candidatus Laterigemmans baculatus]|uniref:sulfatase family protein n=1 Tax=Candidatus Laterigemmans baculatus TaxID=2770505 RepID=UPI0013D94A1B|nr:sulfatase [Candidatus Laterigemmans baculatus]
MFPNRLLAIFLVVAAVAIHRAAPTAGAEPPRPHVVFILVDDLRHDVFSWMDHPFIETPHIDALARRGAVFHNAMVTTSLCSPARATFLTGQYMHRHGVVDNQTPIPEGTATFPQILQQAGYETAFIGKWHMGGSSDAPRPGFDHWVSFRGQGTYSPDGQQLNVDGRRVPRRSYMTDELTEYAIDWLDGRSAEQPFMLYLSHKGVHGLYEPAPRHRGKYQDASWSHPNSMAEGAAEKSGKPMWVQDQRNSWHGVEYPYHGRSGETIGEMYRHYCEMVLSIDESVGRVVEKLRAAGLDRDTLIIFTSDGGHLWGEHGLIDKRCAYEPSIRIPLIATYPAMVPAGTQIDALTANVDVAPTLLELAGVEPPATMHGRSVRGMLAGDGVPEDWREELLYEYYWEWNFPQTPTMFALRGPRFKLIQYYGIWDRDEFYDLAHDPQESRNLIDEPQHEQRIAAMRARVHKRVQESGGGTLPLGFKRGPGANRRDSEGSPRAEFPPAMLD